VRALADDLTFVVARYLPPNLQAKARGTIPAKQLQNSFIKVHVLHINNEHKHSLKPILNKRRIVDEFSLFLIIFAIMLCLLQDTCLLKSAS
jgi:hypothetical protein